VVIYMCVCMGSGWLGSTDYRRWKMESEYGKEEELEGNDDVFLWGVVLSANRPILLSRRAGATAASISVDDPSFSRNVDTSPHDFTPLHSSSLLFTFPLSSTFSLPSNTQSLARLHSARSSGRYSTGLFLLPLHAIYSPPVSLSLRHSTHLPASSTQAHDTNQPRFISNCHL
jgi:hypothetical protein